MHTFRFLFLIGLSSVACSQIAQFPNYRQASPEATPTAAPEDEEEPILLDATDLQAIREAMEKTVTVEGTVTEVFWVRDSVLLITYQEDRNSYVSVSFARFRAALDKAFDGDIVSALKGKKIQVTGKVEEYQYRPQIVVKTADQIKIL